VARTPVRMRTTGGHAHGSGHLERTSEYRRTIRQLRHDVQMLRRNLPEVRAHLTAARFASQASSAQLERIQARYSWTNNHDMPLRPSPLPSWTHHSQERPERSPYGAA